MKTALTIASALRLLVTAAPVAAQHAHSSSMAGMKSMGAAQNEMMQAMHRMDDAMMKGVMDPDPGQAWMKSMAAHHQGAIDMSVIIQKHSKDSKVLAEARKTEAENRKALAELRANMR